MNPLRVFACTVVCSVVPVSLLSQAVAPLASTATSSPVNAAPQKDAQALALVDRMMAATHWSAMIQDAVATGSMSNASDPSAPPRRFTLKMRGRNDYRFDAADGSASTILSGLSGAIVRGDKVTRLPVHVASDRGLMLPMLSLLADSAASDVDLANGDAQQVDGVACTEVKLMRRSPDNSALSKVRSRINDAIVCISADGLPLRVRHTRAALDNQTATFEETIVYSDFRSVSGAIIPFKQQFFLDGQPTTTIQFDVIQINAGPPGDVFRIPAAVTAGGAQ
jgi:hypothetical protein